MNKIQLHYTHSSVSGPVVTVPASKSISNRLLIMRAISNKRISIANLSTADDTVLLSGILENIKYGSAHWQEFHCRNAGTVFRFLTAYLAFTSGKFILRGDPAMERRPVYLLVDALRDAGIQINYRGKNGYPPLEIHGKPPDSPPNLRINASLSSQFVSALLLAAPVRGMNLTIEGTAVSRPYTRLTKNLLQQAGIPVDESPNGYQISARNIQAQRFIVEADWSSSAPWYVLTALEKKGFSLFIRGLSKDSLQGDSHIRYIFEKLGVTTEFREGYVYLKNRGFQPRKMISINGRDYPDVIPYILTACTGLQQDVYIEGISHLRYKESDRIESMKKELAKTGARLTETGQNSISLQTGRVNISGGQLSIHSHDDHRIAMAFAPLAAITDILQIDKAEVVHKSYPGFWQEYEKCGLQFLNV